MGLFTRGPRGRQIDVAPNGLPIHELVNIRTYMRGGGWCAVGGGSHAVILGLCSDGVDVTWHQARAALVSNIELYASVADAGDDPWTASEIDDLRQLVVQLRSAEPETSLDLRAGRTGNDMTYHLLPTIEASRRGATLEMLGRSGRHMWIERAVVPGRR